MEEALVSTVFCRVRFTFEFISAEFGSFSELGKTQMKKNIYIIKEIFRDLNMLKKKWDYILMFASHLHPIAVFIKFLSFNRYPTVIIVR